MNPKDILKCKDCGLLDRREGFDREGKMARCPHCQSTQVKLRQDAENYPRTGRRTPRTRATQRKS